MKKILKSLKINTFALLMIPILTQAQYSRITCGTENGEIYISTDWYIDIYGSHHGIFYSLDNGENIELKYENTESPPAGEMKIVIIFGDATPGALYNYGSFELWVSFDYGLNWNFIENYPAYTQYFSGVVPGTIFKGYDALYKSTDFGFTFEQLPIIVTCPFTEVGYTENEFFGIYGEAGVYYNFVHTIDYGQTYSEIPIDSTVAFHQVGGYHPEISRGTQPGELYLVSWWPDYHYKIFHSVDTGYTWLEKYESEYIDTYFWRVQYTAGRAPGSFYVLRSRVDPKTQDHILLYIDNSIDYGQTFTTYFHELDSTVGINKSSLYNTTIKAFPNPFNQFTSIEFRLPESHSNARLQIFDIQGHLIKEYHLAGKDKIVWDATDQSGQRVASGLYLYQIVSKDYCSPLNKIIYISN